TDSVSLHDALPISLGDVAVAESVLGLRLVHTIGRVEWVHLQLRDPHEIPRPGEGGFVLLVVPDHVADVLAQETFDAFAEFLCPLHIDLLHAVLTQSQLGWWGERRDLPRLDVVVGHIGDEVTRHRERAHRRHGDDLVLAEGRQPRHTQQARPTVDLRRAGTAFARLAIPPYGQIRRLGGLQSVDQVEHDLTLVGLDGVVPQFT